MSNISISETPQPTNVSPIVDTQQLSPPPSKASKKKWIFIGVFLILVIIAGLSSYSYIQSTNIKKSPNTQLSTNSQSNPITPTIIPTTSITQQIESPVSLVRQGIMSDTQLSPYIVPQPEDYLLSHLLWVSNDGWTIAVPNAEGIIIRTPSTKASASLPAVQSNESRRFHNLIATILKSNGFIKNEMNSSKDEKDQKYYDYIQAYENGNFYCVAITNPDGSIPTNSGEIMREMLFICNTKKNFEIAYNEQLPYLKGLTYSSAHITNIKVKGDRMSANVSGRRSGSKLYMYKQNNVWKEAGSVQDVSPCTEQEKTTLPRDYWITCTDEKGNIVEGNYPE